MAYRFLALLAVCLFSGAVGYFLAKNKYKNTLTESDLQAIVNHIQPVDEISDSARIVNIMGDAEEDREIQAARELGLTEDM